MAKEGYRRIINGGYGGCDGEDIVARVFDRGFAYAPDTDLEITAEHACR